MGQRDGVFLGIGRSALVDPGGRGLEPKETSRGRDRHVGQCRIWDLEGDELMIPIGPFFSPSLPLSLFVSHSSRRQVNWDDRSFAK